MINKELSKIFNNMAVYLEMDEIPFKPQAYEKAAIAIEAMGESAAKIYGKGGLKALEEISGVGKGIAEKIAEYIKTGKIKEYELLKKKMPVNLEELGVVEGIGPKKIKILYKKLGVKNIDDLEEAAKKHKIAPLFGFGEKAEKNILEGIKFVRRGHGRFLLGEILPIARDIYAKLKEVRGVEKVDYAGSIRRMKETIGDIDFLVISKDPEKVVNFFVKLPGVAKVWGRGKTKASARMKEGFDMDIRIIPPKSYGAALQYFTGSKEHNIALRKIAIDKGLKLNEYGLFKGAKMIAGKTEEEIYKKLGMDWIPPEIRENTGEIEAAIGKKPPELIELKDIKGDLHTHSNWNGGENSIEEIVETAIKIGYEYIGISDHAKFLKIENGLDEKQLRKRNKEIDRLNLKWNKFGISASKTQNSKLKILKGCEANIMADGSVDIDNKTLAEMDFVIAGIHSQFKMTKEKMTERIIKAMENKNIDILSHPTGRIIGKRDEYQIDFNKILKAAKKTKTILEINAHPARLDLKDIYIKKVKEAGVKMIVNSDAHHIRELKLMEYGVAQARRGWAEKKDIINCWEVEKLLNALKKD
jgi:DNA polymerase (family 10)